MAIAVQGWGYWGWGWWFWVLWAVIIFLIIWGFSWGWGTRRGTDLDADIRPPEEQILRERYARGEINKEEFEQRLKDLHRAA